MDNIDEMQAGITEETFKGLKKMYAPRNPDHLHTNAERYDQIVLLVGLAEKLGRENKSNAVLLLTVARDLTEPLTLGRACLQLAVDVLTAVQRRGIKP